MITFQLDQLGADEYSLTYHRYSALPWTLLFRSGGRMIEVEGTSIEASITNARRAIRMNREQYTNAVQEVLDKHAPDLVAIPKHYEGGALWLWVGDAAEDVPLIEIDMEETSVDQAVEAVRASLPLWGFRV